MALARKSLIGMLVIAGIVALLRSNLLANSYLLLTESGFYIPAESSILTFRVLQRNPGSGDWWLYGVDGRYHYAQSDEDPRTYHLVDKNELPHGFEPLDRTTWSRRLSHAGSQ
ncbi:MULTISPECIES: hypothetical protein [Paracoccaceae]|jgi:hypothetical protein|uniref:hypothetical protein n=1 Tax=Rhodobacterales TaxID=204455 RepID=UPI001D0B9593|nr:hypothetical protein [Boseongicola sp. H5]